MLRRDRYETLQAAQDGSMDHHGPIYSVLIIIWSTIFEIESFRELEV